MEETKIKLTISQLKQLLRQQVEICQKQASVTISNAFPAYRKLVESGVDEIKLQEVKKECLEYIEKSKPPRDIEILENYLK